MPWYIQVMPGHIQVMPWHSDALAQRCPGAGDALVQVISWQSDALVQVMPWHSSALARLCPFQVRRVLRQHHIKPHWMFALDDAVSRAVQAALTVLVRGGWHWETAGMRGCVPPPRPGGCRKRVSGLGRAGGTFGVLGKG